MQPKNATRLLTLVNGYWRKKIKGKVYYFGRDYETAVRKYLQDAPYLERGMATPQSYLGNTVADLLNEFLSNRKQKLDRQKLSKRTYQDYVEVCDMIAASIPKTTPLALLVTSNFESLRDELEKGKKQKFVCVKTLDRRLGYARTIFRFASSDNRLIDRPIPCSETLACVPLLEIRKHRDSRPRREIAADDIRKVLEIAAPKFKLAILLGINGGFNNSDVAHLTVVQAKNISEVLTYPRHKTYFKRVTPLWPETRAAIDEVLAERIQSKEPYLLLSEGGKPYFDLGGNDQISKNFYRYLVQLELYTAGKNFGALRTTFSNVGKEIGDDHALKALMGHSDGSSLYEHYASGIFIPRLKRITDHVHNWLFNTD